MPERVKKLEGQLENVQSDLKKISESLSKLEEMGVLDLAKVSQVLVKLLDYEAATLEAPKSYANGGSEYVA